MPSWIVGETSTTLWILALAAAVCIAWFVVKRTAHGLVGLAICAVLAVGVALADWAVVTDREAIERLLDRAREAFYEEDIPAILELLGPEFRTNRFARAQAETALRQLADQMELTRLRFLVRRINVTEGSNLADVRLEVVAQGSFQGTDFGLYRATWELRLRRLPEGRWVLSRAEQVSGPGAAR